MTNAEEAIAVAALQQFWADHAAAVAQYELVEPTVNEARIVAALMALSGSTADVAARVAAVEEKTASVAQPSATEIAK